MKQDDRKGKVEQIYATKETSGGEYGASFTSNGQFILFGCGDGCVLVWDKKGDIVCGLNHGEGKVGQGM
jgi:hypothetical protein